MHVNLQVKLYPTKQMKAYLDVQCDYRRYCWNKALEVWNDLYDQRAIMLSSELKQKIKESLTNKNIQFTNEEKNLQKEFPSPNERRVRNELVANKSDWEYKNSSRILQLAVKDLSNTWFNFLINRKRRQVNQNLKVARTQSKVSKLIPHVLKTIGYY